MDENLFLDELIALGILLVAGLYMLFNVRAWFRAGRRG